MFKSFAASLLAAVTIARGTADGSTASNAYVTELINVKEAGNATVDESGVILTFFNYNAESENSLEFHGDTHLTVVEPRYSAMTYGWCISDPAAIKEQEAVAAAADVEAGDAAGTTKITSKRWDCQRVRANIDPATQQVESSVEAGTYTSTNRNFEVTDGWFDGKSTTDSETGITTVDFKFDDVDFTPDTNIANEAEFNWAQSTAKSYKQCAPAESDDAKMTFFQTTDKDQKAIDEAKKVAFVTCNKSEAQADLVHSLDAPVESRYGVNNHWWRNFETDNSVEDMQLSFQDNPENEWEIFGFWHMSSSIDYAHVSNDDKSVVGKVMKFKPQSAVFKANIMAAADAAAAEKAAADKIVADEAQSAADKKIADDAAAAKAEEEGTVTVDSNDKNEIKDGATQIAAHATAVLAAVYALAF